MKKTEIFTLGSPYREDLKITGYTFGQGQKSACIVGSIRGNEVQAALCLLSDCKEA